MIRSALTALRVALIAAFVSAFAASSFAAETVHLFLKANGTGKTYQCDVNKDGTFECPVQLPAGTYEVTLSWSWGATNSGASSSSSSGKVRGVVTSVDLWNWRTTSGSVVCSYNVVSPRDVSTGQSSGKRQHKPMVITKTYDKASPMLAKSLSKSSPKLSLGTIDIDQDCDGISGKITGTTEDGKACSIESWSWGETNSGSSTR